MSALFRVLAIQISLLHVLCYSAVSVYDYVQLCSQIHNVTNLVLYYSEGEISESFDEVGGMVFTLRDGYMGIVQCIKCCYVGMCLKRRVGIRHSLRKTVTVMR